MHHVMLEGVRGFTARFDDLRLVHDALEEIPDRVGLRTIMPPFLLPYYKGVVPDDCGISGFIFLAGGHVTLHTLSRRQTYFMDAVAPRAFDTARLRALVSTAFPCESAMVACVERDGPGLTTELPDAGADFGLHLLLNIEGYRSPEAMGDMFDLLTGLPAEVGMTPIMRPYVVQYESDDVGRVVSGLTMLAESHASLHVFKDETRAYVDIFSCRFFDRHSVVSRLMSLLPGTAYRESLVARGRCYRHLHVEPAKEAARARRWVDAVKCPAIPEPLAR